MNVVAFAASPRAGGNSETLLDEVIAGLREADIAVRKIRTHELDIEPCRGCFECRTLGRCVIDDSFRGIRDSLIACDGVVFASPLYFMNVPAKGKAVIDRFQAFWVAKNQLRTDPFGGRRRYGLLVACSGKHHGPENAPIFRGIEDTLWSAFNALGVEPLEPLLVSGVDTYGQVLERPQVLEEARQRGRQMAQCIRMCHVL